MKLEVEVDDAPHSRHQWATESGKIVVLVMPLGLTKKEEADLGDKLVRFGKSLKEDGEHGSDQTT